MFFLSIVVSLFFIKSTVYCDDNVVRGRNEGTALLSASNVMGNGNITLFVDLEGSLSDKKLGAIVGLGGRLGIAEIMQLNLRTSFIDFSQLGPTSAQLQITTPRNDKLRFFGAALRGDLYLSTAIDTLGSDADETKPTYKPYPSFCGIVDFDWMAMGKKIPLKTYFSVGMTDNTALMFKYDQIATCFGIEYKLNQHAIFLNVGRASYKQKIFTGIDNNSYDEHYIWLAPGGRYRFKKRFSLLWNVGLTVYKDTKDDSDIDPSIISINLTFEAPVFYRETNAEAIRTLIFMEKDNVKKNDDIRKDVIGSNRVNLNKYADIIDDAETEEETFDYKREHDLLIKRREDVLRKMDHIEKLLEEDEEL